METEFQNKLLEFIASIVGLFEKVGIRKIKKVFTLTNENKGQVTILQTKQCKEKQKQEELMKNEIKESKPRRA